MSKVKNSKTLDQRREQAEALQASIVEQVEQLRDGEQWARFLTFAQAFHAYSINNLLLILSQNPYASRVAGFRKWQQLGRQVRKGERGIKIFGYAQKKITAEDGEGDEEERTITYFPILTVFDIAQTDPIDPTAPDPSTVAQKLQGDDPSGIYAATAHYLNTIGWTVEREQLTRANGYTDPASRRVVIGADLSPAQAAKTALHEAAHALLHADLEPAAYLEHRGIAETEAESVAYVAAGVLGLDTSAYSIGYVAGWSHGDADTIKATAANVLKTAHQLVDNLVTA